MLLLACGIRPCSVVLCRPLLSPLPRYLSQVPPSTQVPKYPGKVSLYQVPKYLLPFARWRWSLPAPRHPQALFIFIFYFYFYLFFILCRLPPPPGLLQLSLARLSGWRRPKGKKKTLLTPSSRRRRLHYSYAFVIQNPQASTSPRLASPASLFILPSPTLPASGLLSSPPHTPASPKRTCLQSLPRRLPTTNAVSIPPTGRAPRSAHAVRHVA